MRSRFTGLMTLVAAAFLLSACGWLADDAIEAEGGSGTLTATADEGSVTVEETNDSGHFEFTSEEGTVRIATGSEARLPDTFPEDIPLYPGFRPDMATTLPDGGFSLSGAVRAHIPEVAAHFERRLEKNGWIQTGRISQEHVASLTYEKDNRKLQITATPDVSGTMLNISTSNE